MKYFILTLTTLLYLTTHSRVLESTQSGNWDVTTTWSPASVPADNDTIIINTAHVISMVGNYTYQNMKIIIRGSMVFGNGKKLRLDNLSNITVDGGSISGGNPGTVINIGTTSVYTGSDPPITTTVHCNDTGCHPGYALPITLKSFSVLYLHNMLTVQWITLSEFNNLKFEIEYSNNGIDWECILTVPGKNVPNTYTHNIQVQYQQGYVRLKQIDYDGSVTTYPAKYFNSDITSQPQFKLYTIVGHEVRNIQNHLNELLILRSGTISRKIIVK